VHWLRASTGTKTAADQQLSQAAGEPERHSRLWRGVRWGLALLLAGIAAWLSTRHIRWPVLGTVLAESNLLLLGVALATVLVTTVAKAARWHVLLQGCNAQVSVVRVLRVLLVGQMGNSFLPARLGDVGRVVLVGPQTTGGTPAVLGTILVEKTLDGLMGLLVLVGLALWTPLPAWLRNPVLGLAALTGGLLVLLALAATQRRGSTRLLLRLLGWLPVGVQVQAKQMAAGFQLGLGLFSQPAHTLLALALSGVVWGLAALTNVVTLAALGITAPGWSTWLVLITGYAANFLPSLPAQVGVFEYACILALTATGVGSEPALAFGLVLHLLVYAPPTILGPLSMAVEGLNWGRWREAQDRYLEYDGVSR
jgi:glycosyltransferase 2 family protein